MVTKVGQPGKKNNVNAGDGKSAVGTKGCNSTDIGTDSTISTNQKNSNTDYYQRIRNTVAVKERLIRIRAY